MRKNRLIGQTLHLPAGDFVIVGARKRSAAAAKYAHRKGWKWTPLPSHNSFAIIVKKS